MMMRILLLIYAMSSSFIIGSQNKPAESHSNNSSSLAVSSIALVTEFDILNTRKKVQSTKSSWNFRKLLVSAAIAFATFSAGIVYERTTAKPVIERVMVFENYYPALFNCEYDLGACKRECGKKVDECYRIRAHEVNALVEALISLRNNKCKDCCTLF